MELIILAALALLAWAAWPLVKGKLGTLQVSKKVQAAEDAAKSAKDKLGL